MCIIKISFSISNSIKSKVSEISIWISPNEDNDQMSEIIQSYFDWRFKDLSSKNTSMSFDNDGKLVLNFN